MTAQAPKAEFKLKLMGINRTLDPWKLFQAWAQAVEKRTNGRVQFELTSLPELSLGGRLGRERDHDVVALVPVVDLIRETAPAPALDVLHLPGVFRDDRGDPIRRGAHRGFVGLSGQDEHALVLPQTPPPLVWTAPLEGEQEVLRVVQQCTGPARTVAPRYDIGSARIARLPCTSEEARAMTTIHDLKAWKAEGRRFTMLTAYDFPTAQILDRAGIPVLLVGDSVANNVLGYEDTLPVTMDEMLHHTRAVSRGAERAMVVGDLPFLSYQVSLEDGVRNAGRLIKEGGAQAVKLEGPHLDLVHRLVDIGIPVMAHVGLTPQSVHAMGGYKVQGRGEAADRVAEQAEQLEKAGAFSIVLEAMPAELAGEITRSLQIPTIGIGAGPSCDAQVLVINDLLGITDKPPKLAKKFADLRGVMTEAVQQFIREVETGTFPDDDHSYG